MIQMGIIEIKMLAGNLCRSAAPGAVSCHDVPHPFEPGISGVVGKPEDSLLGEDKACRIKKNGIVQHFAAT